MMQTRGQFLTTEFLFVTATFCLLLIIILTSFSDIQRVIDFESMDKKSYNFAFNTSEILVNSKGVPTNWQDLDLTNVKVMGLTKTNNELDVNKLQKFLDYNLQYSAVKDKFGLGQYNLYISFIDATNGNQLYEFGVFPSNSSAISTVIRYCVLNQNPLKIIVKVWK